MYTIIKKPEKLLELLSENRELIQRNNRSALEMLKLLNDNRPEILHDECLLSLELNNSMVQFYFYSNYQKAIENSLNVISMDTSAGSVYRVWHLWLVGHCNACMGREDDAFEFLQQAREALSLLQTRHPVLGHEIFHSLAINSHISKGGVDVTLPYLKQALEAIVYTDDVVRKANCLTGMGNVYLDNELPEKALPNYLKAAEMYEARPDRQNLAMVYSNIGLCYLGLKETGEAERYLFMALEEQLKASSPEHLGNTYHNLSLLYKEKKYWARAQYYLNKSKEIFVKTGNKPALEASEQLQTQLNILEADTYLVN